MILYIPTIESWEAVATCQLLQSLEATLSQRLCVAPEQGDWYIEAGLHMDVTYAEDRKLDYSQAYRKIDNRQASYLSVLAEENGFERGLPVEPLQFPLIQSREGSAIIVCPFGLKRELDLPLAVWKPIVKFLRSYGVPVQLMGEQAQRMDGCAFIENDILSYGTLHERLTALAGAGLVVGVPNWAMWAATAWKKKSIVLYPENLPHNRWYWWAEDWCGRITYDTHKLQTPLFLAGMRQVIKVL